MAPMSRMQHGRHLGMLFQPAGDGAHFANAAAKLHGDFKRREDRLYRAGVARGSGEGAVEIDDMQIFEPLSLEGARLFGGVVVEHGGAGHVALGEPHALPFL